MKKILITGGLGYIGSHTVIDLLKKNYEVHIIDNLSNSSIDMLDKIKTITKKDIPFYKCDISDNEFISEILLKNEIKTVIHFAALKSIPESIIKSDKYYLNNVEKLKSLINCLKNNNVVNFIFSSSASVYSESNSFPVDENSIIDSKNPYSHTKVLGEEFLSHCIDDSFNIGILRYFNPIGNHNSGIIGDYIKKDSQNIIPMILKSITNNSSFNIYGSDYETEDGTAIRDYIHVSDLASAHETTIDFLNKNEGLHIFNVGLGKRTSVLDLIKTFMNVNNCKIKINLQDRRSGDLPICYADNKKIITLQNWKPQYDIADMCKDVYTFLKKNYI